MSELERIEKRPMPLSQSMFDCMTSTSLDRESVTHVCEMCGVVEPREITIKETGITGYMRRSCQCEERAREKKHREQIAKEQREDRIRWVSARAYGWLKVDQPNLAEMTFESFKPEVQPSEHRAAIVTAHSYAAGYATGCLANVAGQPNLLFFGTYGTGKTHLACSIVNVLRENGVGCLFTAAQDFFDALYAADFEGKQKLLKSASDTPLLVIDDLDKLHVRADTDGAFQKRTLFDILDRRYKGRRPTIITTNAQDDLSPWLDGASISRLSENLQPLPMNGADFRRLKRAMSLASQARDR